jgi:hypothetical protein
MDIYFNLVGDAMPNTNGEIHLEPITIKEIYGEYNDDLRACKMDTVNSESFTQLWKECFPYVLVREFKAVTG